MPNFDFYAFKRTFDTVTVFQLVMSVIMTLVFAYLVGVGFLFVAICALIATYSLRLRLAPAEGFWQHFPSWFGLCVAAMLWMLYAEFGIFFGWLLVLVLATLLGLAFGRQAAKFAS